MTKIFTGQIRQCPECHNIEVTVHNATSKKENRIEEELQAEWGFHGKDQTICEGNSLFSQTQTLKVKGGKLTADVWIRKCDRCDPWG